MNQNAVPNMDLVDDILAGSTDVADAKMKERTLELARESLALGRDIAAVAKTGAGAHLFEWLERCTVALPAFVPGIGEQAYTGLDAVHQGFLREGQNSIYRELVRLRDMGNNPPAELLAALDGAQ